MLGLLEVFKRIEFRKTWRQLHDGDIGLINEDDVVTRNVDA